jgi:spore coat polysaccharide biosynthesis protein SpsF (cytidylyltransferase family)
VFGVIQARMGSTRLPGKVIAPVCGHPIIWHIADRLGYSKRLAGHIVATSAGADCDPIRDAAAHYGLECFSGPEDDLIQRLGGAARHCGADAIVRVTADCPFVDPLLVDRMVDVFDQRGQEIDCVVNYLPRRFPHGLDLEVYPLRLLDRLDREVSNAYDREWFPSFVSTRPEVYRIASVTSEEDLSSQRWTVDYPEDLEFCRAVYERLWRPGAVFGMRDMLGLLAREPAIGKINQMHVKDAAPPAAPTGEHA